MTGVHVQGNFQKSVKSISTCLRKLSAAIGLIQVSSYSLSNCVEIGVKCKVTQIILVTSWLIPE